eukprot:Trichotokara_eunicae@DN1788_c0_g1_i1.p1
MGWNGTIELRGNSVKSGGNSAVNGGGNVSSTKANRSTTTVNSPTMSPDRGGRKFWELNNSTGDAKGLSRALKNYEPQVEPSYEKVKIPTEYKPSETFGQGMGRRSHLVRSMQATQIAVTTSAQKLKAHSSENDKLKKKKKKKSTLR